MRFIVKNKNKNSQTMLNNVRVSPTTPNERVILSNISGHFKNGLNAILGVSGAGKTSLLNVIAKRIHSTSLSGVVKLNSIEYTQQNFKQFGAYIT